VAPLAPRDAAANDITSAFNFHAAPRDARLLGTSREPPVPHSNASSVVYLCYGMAVLVLSVLLATAGLRHRRFPRGELA
jgi:phospholipase C